MFNFDFYNPTHIVFGKDRLGELDTLVPKDAKVLIIYGGGSAVRSGLIDRIVKALGNRKVEQFGGIEPNPSLETCERAVAFIKEHGVDFVLAVGGGSVVDATNLSLWALLMMVLSLKLLKLVYQRFQWKWCQIHYHLVQL